MQKSLTVHSLFFAGVILTFPEFFIFNPFTFGFSTLGVLQTFSTLGWGLALLAPLAYFALRSTQSRKLLLVFMLGLWPLSVLAIRVFLLSATGDPGWQYLIDFPVFLVTDLIAPTLLIIFLLGERTSTRN